MREKQDGYHNGKDYPYDTVGAAHVLFHSKIFNWFINYSPKVGVGVITKYDKCHIIKKSSLEIGRALAGHAGNILLNFFYLINNLLGFRFTGFGFAEKFFCRSKFPLIH